MMNTNASKFILLLQNYKTEISAAESEEKELKRIKENKNELRTTMSQKHYALSINVIVP